MPADQWLSVVGSTGERKIERKTNMTFALYALLSQDSPHITTEILEAQLTTFFRNDTVLKIERERLPFETTDSLALRWNNWFVRIFYTEGQEVVEESIEINKRLSSESPFDLSRVNRRICAVFGSDEGKEYTNEIIYVIDFLGEIHGVVIFDPQRNDLLI